MKIEHRLLPVLLDGIEVIKMILYMKLRAFFAQRQPGEDQKNFQAKLCGCIVNELFGTSNGEEPFASFATENHAIIEIELHSLAGSIPEMLVPLTDALRIQTICDFQEGIDSRHILQKAQNLGILLSDREMPMPHTFIALVRKMGNAFGLVSPLQSEAH